MRAGVDRGAGDACLVAQVEGERLQQIAVAEQTMPVLRLDPEKLLAGSDEINAAISWAGDRISAGPVIVAASAPPETVARLQSQYGREASGHAIETATSTIAAELVTRGVRRLVVAGGETSGAAVDRLGIPAFLIGPEIAPGVPVLHIYKCRPSADSVKCAGSRVSMAIFGVDSVPVAESNSASMRPILSGFCVAM